MTERNDHDPHVNDHDPAAQTVETGTGAKPKPPLLDRPVGEGERVSSVDTLRGFALFGILVVNITFFSQPFVAFMSPHLIGGFTGLNFATWTLTQLLFTEKFISIFSMLFGAGLVLMSDRAAQAGRNFGKIYFRRLRWLFIIGMIHAYFLWGGDILVSYALCGFVLYPFRKKTPRFLIIAGIVFLVFGMLLMAGAGAGLGFFRGQAERVTAAVAAGEEVSPDELALVDSWKKVEVEFMPTPEKLAEEIAAYRGGFWEIVKYRAPFCLMMQTQAFFFMYAWRLIGLMLIGMGLLKAGVFSAARSMPFYRRCLMFGYGLGLPLVAIGIYRMMAHDFDVVSGFLLDSQFNYVGSFLVALGHIGLLMMVFKSGWLSLFTRRLTAVGRMALTNYLMHTVVFIFVFYGFGLGLFGRVDRFPAFCMVVAMWLIQLYLSPFWLRRYWYGPAEWFWRTMTYRKKIPFRRNPPAGEPIETLS